MLAQGYGHVGFLQNEFDLTRKDRMYSSNFFKRICLTRVYMAA